MFEQEVEMSENVKAQMKASWESGDVRLIKAMNNAWFAIVRGMEK